MPFIQAIILEDLNPRTRNPIPASATTINTIEKCFVDLNFQLNENVKSFIPINNVRFSSSLYSIPEGSVGTFSVNLSNPSSLGLEEVDLYFVGTNVTGATLNEDIIFGFPINEPLRISWSGGEQEKTFSFTALTDYLIENIEQFYFKLDHFTNCKAVSPSAMTINVLNTASFPSVAIKSTNGSYVQNNQGVYKLNFGLNEGDDKNIEISLSYPSVLGQEEVDVVFINQTAIDSDYQAITFVPTQISPPNPIRLKWEVGQQTKTISFRALSDENLFESPIETLLISLQNPINTAIEAEPTFIPISNIGRFPFASIQIYNQAPIFEYARVYLTPFFTQAGRNNSNATLKKPYADYNNGYTSVENGKFIPYNSTATDTYSPPFNNTQTLNNFNRNKLSLEIKNIGNTQVLINNTVVPIDGTITINNIPNSYYIDLPANLGSTTNVAGETTYSTTKYELTFNMQYVGNNPTTYINGDFKLKNLNNTDASSTQKFKITNVELNTFPQNTYTQAQNIYYATTKFSGIGTGRNGNQCPLFGFLDGTVENAQIDGISFIDARSTTQYTGIEFVQNGGIVPTCNSSQYIIPYRIIP
jgi:hypothetical protein